MKGFHRYIFPLLLALTACTEVVEIDIPEHESLLVVEGYVEPDKFFICSVFETVSYFSDPGIPTLDDVVVVLSSADYFTDTLEWVNVYEDIGYYQGHYIIPRDYNTLWRLEVTHPSTNRFAWGETYMSPPQQIDSVGLFYSTPTTAKLQVYFHDTAGRKDYYQYWAGYDVNQSPMEDFHFRDQYFDGTQYVIPTTFEYKSGDFVYLRLLHVSSEFYDFLNTVEQANSIGWDTVQEPLNVKGNIHGGLGIFTGFDAPAFPVYVP